MEQAGITTEDLKVIGEIVKRSVELNLLHTDGVSLFMDLEYAHKQFNLRLEDFLKADDLNFVHDVSGIQCNIDRNTKVIRRFLPRFAGTK